MFFDRQEKPGVGARKAPEQDDRFFASPVSLFEAALEAGPGKRPAVGGGIAGRLRPSGPANIEGAGLTADLCVPAGKRDRTHRDPFDRLIASTAERPDFTLVTRDRAFASLPGLRTV